MKTRTDFVTAVNADIVMLMHHQTMTMRQMNMNAALAMVVVA